MTDDELIDELIIEEGGYSDESTDRGGATNFGITAKDLGEWRRLGRQASRNEVKALKLDEARAIYKKQYVLPCAWIADDTLRVQVIDFGVNSGKTTAVMKLQEILGVTVDGWGGPETVKALALSNLKLINNALVASRLHFLSGIVDNDATQLIYLHGWVRRAVSFFVR